MEHWRNDTIEKWSTRRKTCSIVKFSITKLTWIDLESNSDLRVERPLTNILNHGKGQGRKLIHFNYSKTNLFYLQTQFVTRRKHSPSRLLEPISYIAQVKRLFLGKIYTKHTNTPCGQNVEYLGALAKLRKVTLSFVMSVCPHGTTPLPLDGFSKNLTCQDFSKICPEN